jgi:hypothetical protein
MYQRANFSGARQFIGEQLLLKSFFLYNKPYKSKGAGFALAM